MTERSIQNKSSCTSKSAQPWLYFWQIQVLAGLSTFWKQSKENIYRSIGSVVKLTWLWSLKDSRISSPKVASYSVPARRGRQAAKWRKATFRRGLLGTDWVSAHIIVSQLTSWHWLHSARCRCFRRRHNELDNIALTFTIAPCVRLAQWNKPSEMDMALWCYIASYKWKVVPWC